MTRVQKRIRAAAILAGVIGGAIILCGHGKKEPCGWERYTVESGETLWSISKEYAPSGTDIRDYIYLLCEKNGIDGTLSVGQVIEVACYE